MIDLRDILSKIQQEAISIIQEEVPVQFDNSQQTPLGFRWRGNHYEVLKPLLVSKGAGGHLHYLLLTSGGVFCLSLVRDNEDSPFCRSRWVLRYRVKIDDSAGGSGKGASLPDCAGQVTFSLPRGASKLVVPLTLLNVAYYHGHLCPELAVGYRAALVAQRELSLARESAHKFFVLAENMTSAIDALQYMTGCTIGNQNFFAYDLGKHVYYFGRLAAGFEPQEVLRVALISTAVDLGHVGEIEERIVAGEAGGAEVEKYQRAVDRAVQEILDLPEEKLFSISRVLLRSPWVVSRRRYARCCSCGEVVAVEKSVLGEDGLLCQVCAAKAI